MREQEELSLVCRFDGWRWRLGPRAAFELWQGPRLLLELPAAWLTAWLQAAAMLGALGGPRQPPPPDRPPAAHGAPRLRLPRGHALTAAAGAPGSRPTSASPRARAPGARRRPPGPAAGAPAPRS